MIGKAHDVGVPGFADGDCGALLLRAEKGRVMEVATLEAGVCKCCGQRLYAEVDYRAIAAGETQSWDIYHTSPRCNAWKNGQTRNDCIARPAPFEREPLFMAAIAANTAFHDRASEGFAHKFAS